MNWSFELLKWLVAKVVSLPRQCESTVRPGYSLGLRSWVVGSTIHSAGLNRNRLGASLSLARKQPHLVWLSYSSILLSHWFRCLWQHDQSFASGQPFIARNELNPRWNSSVSSIPFILWVDLFIDNVEESMKRPLFLPFSWQTERGRPSYADECLLGSGTNPHFLRGSGDSAPWWVDGR